MSTTPWIPNDEPMRLLPWSVKETWTRSCPVGGFGLVLRDERSQLKLKPNEAAPVNPAVGGSCPPPVPVQAVSTATRMTVAAHERDRRRNGGALVFIRISKVAAAGGLDVGSKHSGVRPVNVTNDRISQCHLNRFSFPHATLHLRSSYRGGNGSPLRGPRLLRVWPDVVARRPKALAT